MTLAAEVSHPSNGPTRAAAALPPSVRTAIVTLLVSGYVGLGFWFRLGAEAYLLLGIPITVAFQAFVARQPIRSLWLREPAPLALSRRLILTFVILAIAPAVVVVRGLEARNFALTAWGAAAMVGALGAVYAGRAMDREAVRSTLTATALGAATMAAIMLGYRLVSGGLDGHALAAAETTAVSFATYVPVVFVMEEVLFRGAIDTYLHDATDRRDPSSALIGSALWGLWHLPVMSVSLGIWTVAYLVIVHVLIGLPLTASWRRTGNLAAPGIAHAAIDAVRNGIATL